MHRLIRLLLAGACGLALMASAAHPNTGRVTRSQAALAGGPAPECMTGSDGRNVCGYNCKLGSAGQVACADTPEGVCANNADGSVSCSRLASGGPAAALPPPECRMGSDGRNVCGYNCRLGSRGFVYCASHPDYHCRLNADGTFTCP